jgi:hypothetical protein
MRFDLAYKKTLQPFELQGLKNGTPEGTRTPNLLIRSQTIYPIDLRVPCGKRGAKRSVQFTRLSRYSALFSYNLLPWTELPG